MILFVDFSYRCVSLSFNIIFDNLFQGGDLINISDKIKAIRIKQGLTQEYLALKLGYSPSQIGKFENGSRTISPDLIPKIKAALDVLDVPLTVCEIIEFKNDLLDWRDAINDWLEEIATEKQKRLERGAEFSFEPELQMLYTIISIGYYRIKKDAESAKQALHLLEEKEGELSPTNKLRFLSIRGTDAIYINDYKSAFKDLYAAACLNDSQNIIGEGLYYNLAICLTLFGYAYSAIETIMKARALEKEPKIRANYFSISLAINLSRIGKCEKALEVLKICSRNEEAQRHGVKSLHSQINYGLAYVYMMLTNYSEALSYCNKVFENLEAGGWFYLDTLYLKAQILFLRGEIHEMECCVKKGLAVPNLPELFDVMFKAIKHIVNLNDCESLAYVEEIAIPKMLDEYRYLIVIEYYERLSSHFFLERKYKPAYEYLLLSKKYYIKLMKGELPW